MTCDGAALSAVLFIMLAGLRIAFIMGCMYDWNWLMLLSARELSIHILSGSKHLRRAHLLSLCDELAKLKTDSGVVDGWGNEGC